MKFLEDLGLEKTGRIGITNLLSNITTREGSHKGGWARLLKCQLKNMGCFSVEILNNKQSLDEFDTIIFDLGAEYSGSLNLFGGLDDKVFKRLQEISAFQGSLFSWRNALPDISVLESRRTNTSTTESFKSAPASFLGDISRVLSRTQVFDHAYRTDRLLIGDSHTPSVWTPEYMIERRDGRTLKGMLENRTIHKYVRKFSEAGRGINHLMVHCSSIDIRHHLMRTTRPEWEVISMSTELIEQIDEFGFLSVELVDSMGIEDESRELPKTGYFRGTPFYGTRQERNHLREIFNSTNAAIAQRFERGNWSTLQFPKYFFDESGALRFEVMEKPGSVHLSPEHYRWNLEINRERWTMNQLLANIEKDLYESR